MNKFLSIFFVLAAANLQAMNIGRFEVIGQKGSKMLVKGPAPKLSFVTTMNVSETPEQNAPLTTATLVKKKNNTAILKLKSSPEALKKAKTIYLSILEHRVDQSERKKLTTKTGLLLSAGSVITLSKTGHSSKIYSSAYDQADMTPNKGTGFGAGIDLYYLKPNYGARLGSTLLQRSYNYKAERLTGDSGTVSNVRRKVRITVQEFYFAPAYVQRLNQSNLLSFEFGVVTSIVLGKIKEVFSQDLARSEPVLQENKFTPAEASHSRLFHDGMIGLNFISFHSNIDMGLRFRFPFQSNGDKRIAAQDRTLSIRLGVLL